MKPFVKWAGGKTRLLKEIERRLPTDFNTWEDVVYVEPFVGGGWLSLKPWGIALKFLFLHHENILFPND